MKSVNNLKGGGKVKKMSGALLGLIFGFWIALPAGAVDLKEKFLQEEGTIIPLAQNPTISQDGEWITLGLPFLVEVKRLSVRIQENWEVIEENQYISYDKFSKTTGAQEKLQLFSPDGMVLFVTYRKESFNPKAMNLLIFTASFSNASEPSDWVTFSYRIMKEGEAFKLVPAPSTYCF